MRYAGTPRRLWARFKRAGTHPRRSPARLSSSTEFDGDQVVISSGGVVDSDALQMAWSQRVLSILLDTNASRLKGSNKGLGNGAEARGGDGGAGLEML